MKPTDYISTVTPDVLQPSMMVQNILYIPQSSWKLISKFIRRMRIKKVFKHFGLIWLYNWFIISYNSYIVSPFESRDKISNRVDNRIGVLVSSGILSCCEKDLVDDYDPTCYRRIQMNPKLFSLISY